MKPTQQPGVGTVLDRRYGTSTVLGYDLIEGAVRRVEEYRPYVGTCDGGKPTAVERPFCARVGDVSQHVYLYDPMGESPRPYDAACSCCYLGFPHTVDKHDQSGGRS